MSNPKIAIVASTRNRKDSMYNLINSLSEFMPDNSVFMLVDDASDEPYAWPDYRFEERAGISRVKNKCLELAMNYESIQHVFLIDDDVRFLKKDWHLPYINSGEHHLCATFLPYNRSVNKMVDKIDSIGNIYHDNISLKTHLLGNGYCMYFTRHCIETIGGFDTNYNNKYEHCDISRRIYNAGLTKSVYQDILHSHKLIYCLDKDNAVQRSFTDREMQDNLKSSYDYFRSQAKSSAYIEFRT